MDRIDGAGHVGRMFVSEDAATNRPPTEITDDWLNAVQEELVNLVLGSGQELNSGDHSQVVKAVKKILQNAAAISAPASGTPDAITAIYSPVITELTNGMTLYVRAGSTNTTTTPTFTPNSGTIAAKTIVKGNGHAVVAGDIAGGGHWVELKYDETLDKWVILNPATGMTTVTATNDASFADKSVNPASTSWVRGAMAAIATAAGFAYSFTPNGYIKLPSWLGSFVIQWGTFSGTTGSLVSGVAEYLGIVNFPISYPNACYAVVPTSWDVGGAASQEIAGAGAWSSSGFAAMLSCRQASTSMTGSYISVGR